MVTLTQTLFEDMVLVPASTPSGFWYITIDVDITEKTNHMIFGKIAVEQKKDQPGKHLDINFYIMDDENFFNWGRQQGARRPEVMPQSKAILSLQRIITESWNFIPPYSGRYYLILDNTYSAFTKKNVFLEVKERWESELSTAPSERANFIKDLDINSDIFGVAKSYFDEAKNCFVQGNFRASTIMATSALESCIKTDYIRNVDSTLQGERYVKEVKLNKLLNKYLNQEDIGRLPKQYQDISGILIKVRNSLIHPEEFDFSENLVRHHLRLVIELIHYLERKQ